MNKSNWVVFLSNHKEKYSAVGALQVQNGKERKDKEHILCCHLIYIQKKYMYMYMCYCKYEMFI